PRPHTAARGGASWAVRYRAEPGNEVALAAHRPVSSPFVGQAQEFCNRLALPGNYIPARTRRESHTMVVSPLEYVLRHIRQVAGTTGDEPGDGQLLDQFIHHKDETAFGRLLQRHGRMVLGVCRSFLHEPYDIEDAFQATFLVLVRSARSVRK